jgi:hypothetical protein
MRLMESRLGHASVVIAVFYSFRRALFELFPDDVVADDVYVAFRSNTSGYHSVYHPRIRAREARSSSTSSQMLRHKLRKLNANMKELARFWPRILAMGDPWRMMYLTKFAQHWLIAPTILALASLCCLSLALEGTGALVFWGIAAVVLACLQAMSQSRLRRFAIAVPGGSGRVSMGRRIAYVALFHLVLVAVFFRNFLSRQSSIYDKVS